MKLFLQNNISSIFNFGLLVLIFTYPIANINGKTDKVNDNKSKAIKAIGNNKTLTAVEINSLNTKPFTNNQHISFK